MSAAKKLSGVASRVEAGLIGRLAVADLWHEKIVSLCLLLALAAVIAPLLLVLGLKFGTIETFRYRLVEDPANREIRPLNTKPLPKSWFVKMASSPDVGFLIPCTRQIAGSVVLRSTTGKRADVDLIPTAPGDRLLLENDAPIPAKGEVVLAAMAADNLGVRQGDRISVQISRSREGQSELVTVSMRVAGVLSFRASGLNAAYAPLGFLESVESYKDGFPVAEFGTPGANAGAEPQYNGMVILVNQPLSDEIQAHLTSGATGCSSLRVVKPEEAMSILGWSANSGQNLYLLSGEKDLIGENAFESVRNLLRGSDALLLAWMRPAEFKIRIDDGTSIAMRIVGCSVSGEHAIARGISPVPAWGENPRDSLQIVLPPGMESAKKVELLLPSQEQMLIVPLKPIQDSMPTVTTSGSARVGLAVVPSRLAGLICVARSRAMRFDQSSGQFVNERSGYASFRMYARTIDAVEPLRKSLVESGIDVYTESQRIAQVTMLDRQLTHVFWMIAIVGIAGGLAAMVASLYGTVERKRYEFGVLRLIGISQLRLMTFPLWQALIVAGGSYAAALAAFTGMSLVINGLFSGDLHSGESLCRLPLEYRLGGAVLALLLAAIGASAAAMKINQTSPADALRSE